MTELEKFENWCLDNRLDCSVLEAGRISYEYHAGQFRKFSGEPYFSHPFEVARLCYQRHPYFETVCAALLHDTLEDTKITEEEIELCFGKEVLSLVKQLTNPSKNLDLPREERKQIDRDHLKGASFIAKKIKLIDRMVNLRDMKDAEPNFKRLYANESFLLWNECLKNTDHQLERNLLEQIIICGAPNGF